MSTGSSQLGEFAGVSKLVNKKFTMSPSTPPPEKTTEGVRDVGSKLRLDRLERDKKAEAKREKRAAQFTTAATAVTEGIKTVLNNQASKLAERINADKIYERFKDNEIVRRLNTVEMDSASVQASLAKIDDLMRQAGSTVAGQQGQVFFKDNETGRTI